MAAPIPVIDLAPFRNGDAAARRGAARAFDRACRDTGFLVITGHGVPAAVQTALYDAGRAFFDLPLADKLAVRRRHHEQNRGYIPYGEERLVRMHGGDSPPDFKEVFAIGPCAVPEDDYHRAAVGYPNFAPNLWPAAPAALRPVMERYYAAMEGLMRLLAEVSALAFGLPADWFADKLDRHTSHLRLLHYPAPEGKLQPGQLRCGAHTDLGAITILRNEAAPGGLEVRARNGDWVPAPALADSFVVNIGDLMARWSNDAWVSTPHRVVEPPADRRAESRRLSIAYFVRPNYDAEIACIPGCLAEGEAPRYPPTTLQAYAVSRFAAGAGPRAG